MGDGIRYGAIPDILFVRIRRILELRLPRFSVPLDS